MPKQTDLYADFAAADRVPDWVAPDSPVGRELARVTDPESSHAAAARAVDSGLVRGHEHLILDGAAKWPGKTANELAPLIGLTNVQINRRLSVMGAKGLIRRVAPASGKELTIYPAE